MEDRVRFPIAVLTYFLIGDVMDYSNKVISGIFTAIAAIVLPLFVVALVIFALTLIPFLFIWSVNLLFGMEIAFNFWNSVAIYVLIGLFSASRVR